MELMKNRANQTNEDAKFKALVARTVSEVLYDPDFGKKLTEKAKDRLSSARDNDIEDALSLSAVKKKHL